MAASTWTETVGILLPELSERMPDWVVLKNHDRLPEVTGDVDLCVDRRRWDAFTEHLLGVLSRLGDFSVVWCDHYSDLRVVLVVDASSSPRGSALELDLADGIWWKGHRLLDASEVLDRASADPRGFRCASPGTEAAFHLTVESLTRTGALNPSARHFPRIRSLALRDEKVFVGAMRQMHGAAGGRAARRFLVGTWGALDGLLLVARRMARGPSGFLRRAASWVRRRRLRHWRGLPREIPEGTDEWLARVGPGHQVVRVSAANTEASA